MEYVDMKYNNYRLRLGIKEESECNAQISSTADANALTSIENKCLYNESMQLKEENMIQKKFCIQWTEENNNNYDENYNVVNQVLIENCDAETVERYTDFVINGHFLMDMMPTETSEETECPKCGKKFKLKSLKRHFLHCGKQPNLQCDYCSFKTKYRQCLRSHTISKHSNKDKSENNAHLICSSCDKKLHSKRSLEKHTHYCKNPQYFHCNNCVYHTKHKYNLILHIESSHSSVNSVACPRCGKKLKNRNSLYVHLTYCGKEPHLQCKSCLFKTKYKRDFILHSARHLKDV